MGVLRDWNCKAHGTFESKDSAPRCPRGCNGVEPIFLRPPAVRTSQSTKNIDHTLDDLAQHFGLSDLSTRNGSVMSSIKESSKPDHVRAAYQNLYGDPRTEMLRPRFDNPNAIAPMLDGSPKTAALSMRDKNHVGLGDVFHGRMGENNVDPLVTTIAGKSTEADNAKLQSVLESGTV